MYNPPHPGKFIQATYMAPFNLCDRYLAQQLDVTASTLSLILKRQSGIRPEMALRLSIALSRSAESWLAMQNVYDLWQAKQHVDLDNVKKIELITA